MGLLMAPVFDYSVTELATVHALARNALRTEREKLCEESSLFSYSYPCGYADLGARRLGSEYGPRG
jgi:hypothetical protein